MAELDEPVRGPGPCGHQHPALAESVQGAQLVVAADRVEHDVHLGGSGREVRLAVVDHLVGTQAPHELMFWSARGADHVGATTYSAWNPVPCG